MNLLDERLSLLVSLTKREFKLRYLGSILGSYWNLIHPLIMIMIYTLVFSKVMKAKMGASGEYYSYSIYLCSGLLGWNFFSEVIQQSTSTLLQNAAFLKKLRFPPVVLFLATTASAGINFVIAFSIFMMILMIVKPMTVTLFLSCAGVIVLMSLFCLGVGVGIGCLNVFIRDVQQITSVVFQLWFWFTPIVYSTSILPDFAQQMLYLSPAFAFIESLHHLIYFQKPLDPMLGCLMLGWTSIALLFGRTIYTKTISKIRDHL